MTKRRPQLPCIFAKGETRGAIDDRVKSMWVESFGDGPVPFGDLRLSFKRFHCGAINPMGGECPYEPRECARAFLASIREVCQQHDVHGVGNPQGYFVRVAKSSGARRADEAVGRRATAAMMRRTSVPPESSHAATPDPATSAPEPNPELRGLAGPPSGGDEPRLGGGEALDGGERVQDPVAGKPATGLPSRDDGPVSLGDLLGSMGLGSREGRSDDGPEGPR